MQRKFLFAVLTLVIFSAVPVFATEPVVWEIGSRAELLKGEAHGISISDTGDVTLAPDAPQVFNTEQPYIWSSAIDAAGNVYLGTGHDGKLFKIAADGKGGLLFKASELDVTALAIGSDGSIFAATSPDGKVYRVTADGKSEVYFDPEDKYIWSLAVLNDGSLAVGTGDNGKLYRVRSAGAKPAASLLIDTNQTHIMSLAVTARGELIAGTDPGGLVLRISPEGKAFALYDASLREIHALATAPDGSIYALGLGDAAATTKTPTATAADATVAAALTTVVTATDEAGAAQAQPTPARSRNDLSNARSAVFHILPDGGTDIVWSSTTVTAFSVLATTGGVLVGTSDKGRIYSVTNDGRDTLLLQTTEGQVSSLIARGADVFVACSNQGKLIRFGSSPVKEGIYESPVRDAKLVASWGKIWWRGTGTIALQTRSGNTERPDTTWSDWSNSYSDGAGAQIASPKARFIQWRATLKSSPAAARLDDVSLAYIPRNVAPEVVAISILPAGVALQQQIQMPIDPNIEVSGLDAALFGVVVQAPPRRVFQKGARSIQWQAEDRNGDTLEYSVYYRALNETSFRLLKDHIRETFFTVDGASLADGRYVFRVVASDDLDNPAALALSGDRISEPVDIDNTPPVLRAVGQPQVSSDRVRAVFEVEDATGHIKRADVSIDGLPWREVFPDDGIADSRKERYSLDLSVAGPGEHTISLRAYDNSNNAGSLSVTFRR
ncbi:MAG TPA: WD40 repeat domain-containing protein [Pyrinomonadaceae bacterium]|jgi:sugar lactone lactonase YvrE|nr:WD40 repeat domain-containing protein [Pyrinomonadaceae bacterium]